MTLPQPAPTRLDDVIAQVNDAAGTTMLGAGPDALDRAREEAPRSPGDLLVSANDLAVRDGVAARLLRLHAESRGLPPARHAASLVFQRYAHRVAGAAVASWIGSGVILDVGAASCHVLVREGSPVRLLLPTPQALPARGDRAADAATVVASVVDSHLLPVARALHAAGGVSMGNLWGNMGAALAGACRQVSRRRPADAVLACAEALLASRPELRRTGSFRVLDGPAGPRVFFDRRSCCHWYAARDGALLLMVLAPQPGRAHRPFPGHPEQGAAEPLTRHAPDTAHTRRSGALARARRRGSVGVVRAARELRRRLHPPRCARRSLHCAPLEPREAWTALDLD